MKEYDANQHGGEEENRESLVAKGFKRDWGNANGHQSGGRFVSLIVGSVVRAIVRRAGIEPAT